MNQKLKEKLQSIEMFIMDCDGVLTDGRIYYGSDGTEIKVFHARDGKGIKMLQEQGIDCAIITGRESVMVERRAQELGVKEVYQGISDKKSIYQQLLKKYELKSEQTAYIGDDVNDLAVLQEVAFAAAPPNGVVEVKEEVDFVTETSGGWGAVREVINLILSAKGRTD